jgi:hypothetical protein
MQALTNVDDLLAEWEQIKRKRLPNTAGIEDLTDYIKYKTEIEGYAHNIRYARLTNNQDQESEFAVKFIESYSQFAKDYVYRVLKDDKQIQS